MAREPATVSTIREDVLDARARSERFVRCRTYGHAWHEYDSSQWKPEFGDALTLRCERCDTERRDSISRTSGELLARSYVYADEYRYGRDEEMPSRDEFRRLLLRRRIAEAREARGHAS